MKGTPEHNRARGPEWPIGAEQRLALVEAVVRLALDPGVSTVLRIDAMRLLVEMEWENLAAEVCERHGDAKGIVQAVRDLARRAVDP